MACILSNLTHQAINKVRTINKNLDDNAQRRKNNYLRKTII